MITQFSKKTVDKGCYDNLDQFPDTLDINGIIELCDHILLFRF